MKFEFDGKEFYIDGYLASALDSLVYNIKKDWDFVILITGDRTVRVGKSMLAMTIGAYLGSALQRAKLSANAYSINQVYFNDEVMINEALENDKFVVNHYDEAGQSLAKKTVRKLQQEILQFFDECGQLNHVFILVLPDFFELKEQIAVARSEMLINVYRTETKKMVDIYKEGVKRPVVGFERGRFQYFNRKNKERLYDEALRKHQKSYRLVKPDFIGRFTEQWPVSEEEYKEKKQNSLKKFKERNTKDSAKVLNETKKLYELSQFLTTNQLKKMAKAIGKDESYFRKIISKAKKEMEPLMKKQELHDTIGKIEGIS
jgi:hypothetical protein